jgi:hypothetical protein
MALFNGETVDAPARTHTRHVADGTRDAQGVYRGFPILQRKPHSDPRSEIVAVFLGADSAQPFVVWRMDSDGHCEGGDYCSSLASLAAAFERRT